MPRYCNVNSSGVLHSKHAQAASPPCGRATLAGRTVGEIRYPEPVWTIRLEVAPYQILRTGRCAIGHRGAHALAATHPFNAQVAHQTFDRTARHANALAIHLLPDFAGSVDTKVLLPDSIDLGAQLFVLLGSLTTQLWLPTPGGVAPVG